MRTSTPEPRLPLEPEEYPLYKPPRRLGCSALAIVPLVLVGVFALLFWRITPQIAENIVNIPREILGVKTVAPAETTPGTGSLATQTVQQPTATPEAAAALPPTATSAPPSPTPAPEYVKVVNTGGVGVRIRDEPKSDGARVTAVEEGTLLLIVGPDTKTGTDTWRNVGVPDSEFKGWVLSRFLAPASKP